MVEVDFYEKLEVARSASSDEIRAAHRTKTKLWSKRQMASDQSQRHEAETWVRWLAEARQALLTTDDARSKYDAKLSQGVSTPTPATVPAQNGTSDWVSQARDFLSHGDYHAAAYAAREATHTIGNSAESWILRSRANAGLGEVQDALYEAKQATTIDAKNPEYRFHTGSLLETLERWDQALVEYRTAAKLDGSNFLYPLAEASVFLQNGHTDEGISILRRILAAHPSEQIVKNYLAAALFEKAEETPARQVGHSYFVTSSDEIEKMRALASESDSLTTDPDIKAAIVQMRGYLDRMEAKTWHVPSLFNNSVLWAIGIPLMLFVIGIVLIDSIGFLLILASFGAGYLVYNKCWVPRWKAAIPGR